MEIRVDGCVVLINEEDFNRLGKPRLAVYADGRGGVQNVRILGQRQTVYLHKKIFGETPPGYVVDHVNRNVLDNRRENLRLATVGQNNRNNDQHKYSKSGRKGVSWYDKYNCWRAAISVNGKKKHLGYYETVEEAAEAYTEAALKLYGEFSPLHVPTKTAEKDLI